MKIKNILTSLIFSFTTIAFAQVDSLCIKKNIPYRWEISVAMNSVEAQMDQKLFDTWVAPIANYYSYYGNKNDQSVSLSVIPKYRLNDGTLLRFEFGITNINLQSRFNGIGDTLTNNQGQVLGSGNTTGESIIKQKLYRYAAGIQWNLIKKKFIEAYYGISLCYFYYDKLNWNLFVSDNTALLPDYHYNTYTATTPGGFAAGIGMFIGANLYLNKRLSLGGELSYSLLYHQLGGIQSGVYEKYLYTSSNNYYYHDYEQWSIHNNSSKGVQYSKVIPSLNLTIRF